MLVESSSREQLKSRVIGWTVATIVSAGLAAGGIYGWSKEGENPLNQQCSHLGSQVSALETDLFQTGTLGSDGGLIIRYLEIRNPDDPRLRIWGQLKNEKDQVCAEAQKKYNDSFQPYFREAAIIGGAVTLLGITTFLSFKKRLGRKGYSTTGVGF